MRVSSLLAAIIVLGGCGSDRSEEPPSEPVAAIRFERASADLVQHGERLSLVLGCSGCHGADLTGEDWSEPGFGRLWTANLTRAAEHYTDEQLEAVVLSGSKPDGTELWGMPSHLFTQLTDEDLAAVIAFVRSKPPAGDMHPPPLFEDGGRKEIADGTFKSAPTDVREQGQAWPPDAGPQHALGRYVVRATCAECHQMDLGGGEPYPGAKPRPDLRVIVSAYSKGDFETLMRTGKAVGHRDLELMSEVARGRYSHFTERELDALYAYLQAVAAKP